MGDKKYFFDTEFVEDGKTIDLISIGIVSEDGEEFYACSADCKTELAGDWVRDNVLCHISDDQIKITNSEIASEITKFIGDCKPEFWAYYADYDWVALCQLYGTMMELPKNFPMYCNDLKQLCMSKGNPQLSSRDAHHALDDAKWVMQQYEQLTLLC